MELNKKNYTVSETVLPVIPDLLPQPRKTLAETGLGDDPIGDKHAYGFALPVGANIGDEEGAGFGIGKFPGCWIVHGCTHYEKFFS